VRFVFQHTWTLYARGRRPRCERQPASSRRRSSHDDPDGLHPPSSHLPFAHAVHQHRAVCAASAHISAHSTVILRTQPRRLVYRGSESISSHRCQFQQRQFKLEIGRRARQAGDATAWAPGCVGHQGASERAKVWVKRRASLNILIAGEHGPSGLLSNGGASEEVALTCARLTRSGKRLGETVSTVSKAAITIHDSPLLSELSVTAWIGLRHEKCLLVTVSHQSARKRRRTKGALKALSRHDRDASRECRTAQPRPQQITATVLLLRRRGGNVGVRALGQDWRASFDCCSRSPWTGPWTMARWTVGLARRDDSRRVRDCTKEVCQIDADDTAANHEGCV
jgi:hypothetical protein